MSVKQRAIEALKGLPGHADHHAIVETIHFIRSVDKGLKEAHETTLVTPHEVRRRLERCLSD